MAGYEYDRYGKTISQTFRPDAFKFKQYKDLFFKMPKFCTARNVQTATALLEANISINTIFKFDPYDKQVRLKVQMLCSARGRQYTGYWRIQDKLI